MSQKYSTQKINEVKKIIYQEDLTRDSIAQKYDDGELTDYEYDLYRRAINDIDLDMVQEIKDKVHKIETNCLTDIHEDIAQLREELRSIVRSIT